MLRKRMLHQVFFRSGGRVLRQLAVLAICLLNFHKSIAQYKDVSIACIGNSITAGARVQSPELESYPAVLSQKLVGNGYTGHHVRNLGIGGATVLRFGTPNIWKLLDSLKKLPPDIVIVEVGTNETVGAPRQNWEHIGEFEKDYSAYIGEIRRINPNCTLILCSPLDMVLTTEGLSVARKEDLTIRRPRVWQLRSGIKKIARMEGVYFLDLTKPFKGKPGLMTTADGVHPNQDGYKYLADLVFNFMVKKGIISN